MNRRDSSQRPAHEAGVEDIVGMMDFLDAKGQLETVTFAAADLSRVPNFNPEQTNMGSITARQSQLEANVNKLSASMQDK